MLIEQLEEVMSTLTPREEKVLKLRFGLEDGKSRTLEEVGREFKVTRERIRQIEAKALRKLRHPSRSKKLRDYMEQSMGEIMDQIVEFWNRITSIQVIDIIIAIGIIVFFRILSGTFAYMIIRIFKIKSKKAKEIKESAFFRPLKIFFIILGIYLAIVFLKVPLQINDYVMDIVTKAFKIISVLEIAYGLANSLTSKTVLGKKIKKKISQKMDDTVFEFMLKIIRIIIYVIAIFLILAILEINLTGLVAGLGLGGVIITLAAQDTAKNLFGGLVIFIDKPFAVGDWIEMESYEGTIEDITFRTTRIRTFENALVNVPNAIIADASVTNWSKMEKRRYKTNLCVELNTPLEKLELLRVRIEKMLQDRESVYDDSIIVRFDQITDNGINILIYTYTDSVSYASYLKEIEDINMKIMRILKEENIELAYDTKTVYVKN